MATTHISYSKNLGRDTKTPWLSSPCFLNHQELNEEWLSLVRSQTTLDVSCFFGVHLIPFFHTFQEKDGLPGSVQIPFSPASLIPVIAYWGEGAEIVTHTVCYT